MAFDLKDITGIGSVADLVGNVIDKIWPDKAEAEKIKLETLKLSQAGAFKQLDQEFQLSIEQIKVNAVEAASASRFVGGWRPAAGWTCVAGLFYTFLIQPLLAWGALVYGKPVPPLLDTVVLMELLLGMLGLGGLRSYEKSKNVASK